MATKRKKKSTSVGVEAPSGGDNDWRARDDLNTVTRSLEIIKDSTRFRAAKSEAKRQSESLARIGRLKGVKI